MHDHRGWIPDREAQIHSSNHLGSGVPRMISPTLSRWISLSEAEVEYEKNYVTLIVSWLIGVQQNISLPATARRG